MKMIFFILGASILFIGIFTIVLQPANIESRTYSDSSDTGNCQSIIIPTSTVLKLGFIVKFEGPYRVSVYSDALEFGDGDFLISILSQNGEIVSTQIPKKVGGPRIPRLITTFEKLPSEDITVVSEGGGFKCSTNHKFNFEEQLMFRRLAS